MFGGFLYLYIVCCCGWAVGPGVDLIKAQHDNGIFLALIKLGGIIQPMSEHISTSSDKAALDKNPNHESVSYQIRKVFERYNPMYLKGASSIRYAV